ncbi:MAG: TOBE domain-containing protein, partial [Paracoccaceae bacterium]
VGRRAVVSAAAFLGGQVRLTLDLDGRRMTALIASASAAPQVGDEVSVSWSPDDLHLMEAEK